MKLSQISYFLSVCNTLNFTRAAEQCYVSQPSLSAAIHKLEEELGGALFHRGGKQIVLTPFGESMRVHLGRIEEAKKAATLAASSIVEGKPEILNIGIMCTVNSDRLLPIFQALHPEFKDTEILIHDVPENKSSELLLAGALDCIFMAHTTQLDNRFDMTKLATESIVVATSQNHSFADRDSVTLADLHGEKYIDRLRCEFREDFFKQLNDQSMELQVVMRAEREDLAVAAVSKGLGISMMPKASATLAGLATCELANNAVQRDICLVSVKNRPNSPLVDELVSHIINQFTQPASDPESSQICYS